MNTNKKKEVIKMKMVYIVCENLSNEFFDLCTDFETAQKEAEEIGGYILKCKFDENFNIVEKDWDWWEEDKENSDVSRLK